jgi:hypothetical protein
LKFLDHVDLVNFAKTSKANYYVVYIDEIWQKLYKEKVPIDSDRPPIDNWRLRYAYKVKYGCVECWDSKDKHEKKDGKKYCTAHMPADVANHAAAYNPNLGFRQF